MRSWTTKTTFKAVKMPSGAWVRTDHVDAVEERHGNVYVILSCGEHVKATHNNQHKSATEIAKALWGDADD